MKWTLKFNDWTLWDFVKSTYFNVFFFSSIKSPFSHPQIDRLQNKNWYHGQWKNMEILWINILLLSVEFVTDAFKFDLKKQSENFVSNRSICSIWKYFLFYPFWHCRRYDFNVPIAHQHQWRKCWIVIRMYLTLTRSHSCAFENFLHFISMIWAKHDSI